MNSGPHPDNLSLVNEAITAELAQKTEAKLANAGHIASIANETRVNTAKALSNLDIKEPDMNNIKNEDLPLPTVPGLEGKGQSGISGYLPLDIVTGGKSEEELPQTPEDRIRAAREKLSNIPITSLGGKYKPGGQST
jgi:hypothetical protein